MATDALLKTVRAEMRPLLFSAVVLATFILAAGDLGAQCGSALIGEKSTPAAIQGLGSQAVLRAWAAGSAGTASIPDPCSGNGCIALDASPLCEASGDCIALTGIEWLNGSCTATGFLPARVVVLAEGTTPSDGGRWAAVEVDHNPTDANFDLDAAQDRICSGCSSVAGSLIGGGQTVGVTVVGQGADDVTLNLSWSGPDDVPEALNETGESVVTGYSIWVARAPENLTPVIDGSTSGWTRMADLDGTQLGGYSTDTHGQVTAPLGGSDDPVWVAVGLVFDGSGDPGSDSDSVSSALISRGILVFDPATWQPAIFADGFETGDTGRWSNHTP